MIICGLDAQERKKQSYLLPKALIYKYVATSSLSVLPSLQRVLILGLVALKEY